MKILKSGVALLAAAFIVGCATGFEATYDSDPAHDFSVYEKYAWVSDNPMKVGPTSRITNPMLQSRIMISIEDALEAKGYTMAKDVASADFVLSFTIGSREEINVDSSPSMGMGVGYGSGYGYGYPRHGGWGGAYYGVSTDTTVRQYTEGMLALDVFDVASHDPVWHGVATKRIHDSDREDAAGTVKSAVDAILMNFPGKIASE